MGNRLRASMSVQSLKDFVVFGNGDQSRGLTAVSLFSGAGLSDL